MKVSVVISAYNEEAKIEDCILSVKRIANEIIVVNNSSKDKTEEIARKHGAKVYLRENNPMLNINKNFGFSKATSDWILNLDADERGTEELVEEIIALKEVEDVDGYLIPRQNIIFGKWIRNSIWWPDYQLRLFRAKKGRFEEKHVHEYLKVEGNIDKLSHPIKHLNYETISQYLYKLEHIYTESEVNVILESGKTLEWHDALRMPVHDFLKTYFMQKGYRDGLHGLVLSLLQAFYMEIVFAKVWEKQGFSEKNIELTDVSKELKKLGSEAKYWMISASIEEKKSVHAKLVLKLLRKTIRL